MYTQRHGHTKTPKQSPLLPTSIAPTGLYLCLGNIGTHQSTLFCSALCIVSISPPHKPPKKMIPPSSGRFCEATRNHRDEILAASLYFQFLAHNLPFFAAGELGTSVRPRDKTLMKRNPFSRISHTDITQAASRPILVNILGKLKL